MQNYRCLYYNTNGRTESIILSADDESELIRSFSSGDKVLVSIDAIGVRDAFRANKTKTQNLVLQFTETLELLLDSGLTLKEALEISSTVKGKNGINGLSQRMLDSVRKGLSFSKSVETASEIFPPIYRGMILVGERIGSVEKIFPRLSTYLRNKKALRDKFFSALAYPAMVLFVAVLGSIGMTLFIIPKMESIFAGFGNGATIQIQRNINMMKLFFTMGALLLIILILTVPIIHFAGKRDPSFRIKYEKFLICIPIIGPFIISCETLNFAFAMETLTSGNVPVENAIEEAALVVTNTAYREALLVVHTDLIKGVSLSQSFSAHKIFPEYLQQWVTIGERSGKSERVFSQIRAFFQTEVEKKTNYFMTLIEPSLIIGIGIFLLILILGIVVPLFSMYGSLI